jgi:hypothetical protein
MPARIREFIRVVSHAASLQQQEVAKSVQCWAPDVRPVEDRGVRVAADLRNSGLERMAVLEAYSGNE